MSKRPSSMTYDSNCICGFNPPEDCNPDCERCGLIKIIADLEDDLSKADATFQVWWDKAKERKSRIRQLERERDEGLWDTPREKWHTPEDKPSDGDSIWVEVLEYDGKHTHIDYAVAWLDVDGLRMRRFEQKLLRSRSRLFSQAWPPDDVLRWCRCEMPQVEGGSDDE